jgi:hypothetical protein
MPLTKVSLGYSWVCSCVCSDLSRYSHSLPSPSPSLPFPHSSIIFPSLLPLHALSFSLPSLPSFFHHLSLPTTAACCIMICREGDPHGDPHRGAQAAPRFPDGRECGGRGADAGRRVRRHRQPGAQSVCDHESRPQQSPETVRQVSLGRTVMNCV